MKKNMGSSMHEVEANILHCLGAISDFHGSDDSLNVQLRFHYVE